jgi:hypothetical protein
LVEALNNDLKPLSLVEYDVRINKKKRSDSLFCRGIYNPHGAKTLDEKGQDATGGRMNGQDEEEPSGRLTSIPGSTNSKSCEP